MRFNPDTKDKSHLLPEGDYDFEIISADEKTSSNANDMMVLKLRAGSNGTSKIITDYILATNIRKVRSVAKSVDLLDLFQTGEILPEHFVGRRGRARLIVEKARNSFPDRNVVDGYLTQKPDKKGKL